MQINATSFIYSLKYFTTYETSRLADSLTVTEIIFLVAVQLVVIARSSWMYFTHSSLMVALFPTVNVPSVMT